MALSLAGRQRHGGRAVLGALGAHRGPLGLSGNGVCPRNYGCLAKLVLRLFPGSPAASVLASGPSWGRGVGGAVERSPKGESGVELGRGWTRGWKWTKGEGGQSTGMDQGNRRGGPGEGQDNLCMAMLHLRRLRKCTLESPTAFVISAVSSIFQ